MGRFCTASGSNRKKDLVDGAPPARTLVNHADELQRLHTEPASAFANPKKLKS
jgi:hypothetical protein